MNATELAKMLEGWPEGARPSHFPEWKLAWMKLDKSDDPHFIRFGNRYDTQEAEESACMSGLRWLMPRAAAFTMFEELRGGFCLQEEEQDGFDGKMLGSGPTLIHAIDAAIKATKGNQ